MKKLFSILTMACLLLVCGFCLFACEDKTTYGISVYKNAEGADLYDLSLKVGRRYIEPQNDIYFVDGGSKVVVEITARQAGVDFTNFSATVNRENVEIVKNDRYSASMEGEKLYGSFTIPKITKNTQIELSGGKIVTSSFHFEIANKADLEDEEIVEKIKLVSVCTNFAETEEFTSLYDIIIDDKQTSFLRLFNIENLSNYNTFKVKIETVAPFDFSISYPFKIKDANGNITNIARMDLFDNVFLVDMGNIGDSDAYTILVDFDQVNYHSYSIMLPYNNLTYSLNIENLTMDYSMSNTLTINKRLDNSKADYSNMKVFANELELEKIADSETNDSVKYLIPKHITPISTGEQNCYYIKVDGIEYVAETYTLSALSNEGVLQTQYPFINPTIYAVDENGSNIGVIGYDVDGKLLTIEGQRNAVSWEYVYDGYAGGYHSAYDLYDYDIYVNNAKVFNLKEKLGNETQTLLIDIGEYKLRAYYNEETKVFNAFQLEFVCTQDTIVTFENFKKKEKNIYVGQNVNDTRISKIEFSIISSGSAETPTWIELVGTNRRLQSVSCGDIIMFRLTTGREIVGTYEYKIAGTSITGDALEGEVYQESNVNYTICKFMIGDIYFDNNIDCKLVSSAS